jgi:hypothetical protein
MPATDSGSALLESVDNENRMEKAFAFKQWHTTCSARAAIAWFTVITHLLACVGLLLIAPGTETNPDWADRLRFVHENSVLWCGVWVIWMITSASLLAFCLAWTFAMRASNIPVRAATIACGIIAVGVLFDFAGEITLIVAGSRTELDVDVFERFVRTYQILSPAIANGLYCVGGLLLSSVAWRSLWLRGPLGILGFAVWIVGVGLTIGAVIDHRQVMIAAGAIVMVLFIAFAACLGWRMHR